MVGQGSPLPISVYPVRWVLHRTCLQPRRRARWWVCWCAVWALLAWQFVQPASAQLLDLQLRVHWGGGEPRQWEGALSSASGTFSRLTYLGLDADEAATIYLRRNDPLERNEVRIAQRTGREYDGFDVWVRGDAENPLILEIAPSDAPRNSTGSRSR